MVRRQRPGFVTTVARLEHQPRRANPELSVRPAQHQQPLSCHIPEYERSTATIDLEPDLVLVVGDIRLDRDRIDVLWVDAQAHRCGLVAGVREDDCGCAYHFFFLPD